MTQDEIIEMAKEAGLEVDGVYFSDDMYRAVLVCFAKLVAAKATAKEREALAQEQEAVGYWKENAQGLQRDYDLLLADFQAQRTWVGLTDEDIYNLEGFYDFMTKEEFFDAIRGVEAKLKEKNT